MKRIYSIAGILTFTLLFFLHQTSAQEEITERRNVGFGVLLFDLNNYLDDREAYSNAILVPINIGSNFRLEPALSFAFTSNDNNNSMALGIGVFGLVPKNKFDMLFGARTSASIEGVISFAPTVGGEYYLGNHFSLGAEAQLKFFMGEADFTAITNTSCLLRFYF